MTDPADRAQVPIGQHMANLRRKGAKNGLGKDPERAAVRTSQLAAIDPDWDCPWPLDWQRHYRVLADLAKTDGSLPEIRPGVLMDGDDFGKWLQQQRQPATWARLPASTPPSQQPRQDLIASASRPLATFKSWRLRRKLRCSTNWIASVAKTVLVLHHAST